MNINDPIATAAQNAQVSLDSQVIVSDNQSSSAVKTEQSLDHVAAAAPDPISTSKPDQVLTDQSSSYTYESHTIKSAEGTSELTKSAQNQSHPPQSLPLPRPLQPTISQPVQVPSTESQEAISSRLGSRFSVNLSGVGLPSMASNLGLTHANGERAADMAQDLKKNVVNMWNTWFPASPTSTSVTPSNPALDPSRAISGTQSLSHHPQRPTFALRTNSYTMHANEGTNKSLGTQPASSEIPQSNEEKHSTNDHYSISDNLFVERDSATSSMHGVNDSSAIRTSTCVPPPPNSNNGPIYLMGKLYPPSSTQWSDFQQDFTLGLIWCTYRHNYQPIRPSNFTSDVGWGCMLRSGQSLLANALAIQFMGRGWTRPTPGDPMWNHYAQILFWFLDDMNAKSPFSVHRIALLGKQLGKNIGEWFGPSTTSQVTKALVHNFPESGLSVYVTTDGVIYKDQVEEAMAKKPGGFGSLLILVTIRLGIDKLNPIYNDAIKSTFEFPQSLGIAGGRPSSSYYFVGYQGEDLFYLDPHHSRCVIETKELGSYTVEDFATYHCDTIRKIDIGAIDPSMLLAFYCRDRSDYNSFCELVRELNSRPGMGSSIFTIGEHAPDYDDDSTRLLSVADDDDDDLELIL
ncbi:Cysteine protease atg4 [Entomortierella beljakovae]|nr:Cysteine protease atg4 [Entomortierella beljakovae]